MLALLEDPTAWAAFFTLTALELVLGIDNVVFISILVERLAEQRRELARRVGMALALLMRLGLLLAVNWIVGLTAELFVAGGRAFSGRDLVLIGGGAFLLWKGTREVHHLLEGGGSAAEAGVRASFASVLVQIMLLDAVFSLDSIITAVGMVDRIEIMFAAVIASVAMMMGFAGPLGRFVSAHPSVKMLALAFLLMIGLVLVADGFGVHVPKGYVYCSMGFSLMVEVLNLWRRRRLRGAAAVTPASRPGMSGK